MKFSLIIVVTLLSQVFSSPLGTRQTGCTSLIVDDFSSSNVNLNNLGLWTSDDGTFASIVLSGGSLKLTPKTVDSYFYTNFGCPVASYTHLSFLISCTGTFSLELQAGSTCGGAASKYLTGLTCPTSPTVMTYPISQFGTGLKSLKAIVWYGFTSVATLDDVKLLACSSTSSSTTKSSTIASSTTKSSTIASTTTKVSTSQTTVQTSSSKTTATTISTTKTTQTTTTKPTSTTMVTISSSVVITKSSTTSSQVTSTSQPVGSSLVINNWAVSTSASSNLLGLSCYCWLSTGCKSSYSSAKKALTITLSAPSQDAFAEATWETLIGTSETNLCRDISSFGYLHVVVSGVSSSQDWSIRLASSNSKCDPDGNPQYLTWAEVLASKYVQGWNGGQQDLWIPLSHFKFAGGSVFDLSKGAAVSLWSFRTTGSFNLHLIEFTTAIPNGVYNGIAPSFSSQLFTSCKVPRSIAFGVDDGDDTLAQEFFSMLANMQVLPTVFTRGDISSNTFMVNFYNNLQKNGSIYLEAHTWSHGYLSTMTDAQLVHEITDTQNTFASVFGVRPTLFRPSYGVEDARVRELCGSNGLSTILWNVDIKDWQTNTASGQLAAFQADLDAYLATNPDQIGALVVAHYLTRATLQAFPSMINYARSKGLKVMPVHECLGLPASQ